MLRNSIQQTFTAALDALVEEIKKDRAILAVVLCGSLSHDTVWAKSDIDLVLVTIDDRKVENAGLSLNADGVNVHAVLMPRTEFRKVVEGSANNSFFHSFLAKGRLLYTTDPSIEDLCARLHTIGQRDTQLELLRAGTSALPPIDKAHKWFVTRGDLDYSALWILYAATPLARIEVIGRRLLADREVLPQALALNLSHQDFRKPDRRTYLRSFGRHHVMDGKGSFIQVALELEAGSLNELFIFRLMGDRRKFSPHVGATDAL